MAEEDKNSGKMKWQPRHEEPESVNNIKWPRRPENDGIQWSSSVATSKNEKVRAQEIASQINSTNRKSRVEAIPYMGSAIMLPTEDEEGLHMNSDIDQFSENSKHKEESE
jgi:3'-phosphoadenosine 5'-phosphosulfate sulfotransferase